MDFLGRKLGPLPYWAWGLLLVAAIAAFIIWRRGQSSASGASGTVPGASVTPSPQGGGGWGDTWGTPQPVGPGSTGSDTGLVSGGASASGTSYGATPPATRVPIAASSSVGTSTAGPIAGSGPGTSAFAKAHGPITGSTLSGVTSQPAARPLPAGFKGPQFRKY